MLQDVALGPEAHVAGQLVRVLERLLEERLAGLEVVVDERGRDARVHRDARDPDLVDPVARDPLHGGGEDALAGAPLRCGCAWSLRGPRGFGRRTRRWPPRGARAAPARGRASRDRPGRSPPGQCPPCPRACSACCSRAARAECGARRSGGGSRTQRRERAAGRRGRCARSRPGRDRGRWWCSGRSSRSARRAGPPRRGPASATRAAGRRAPSGSPKACRAAAPRTRPSRRGPPRRSACSRGGASAPGARSGRGSPRCSCRSRSSSWPAGCCATRRTGSSRSMP